MMFILLQHSYFQIQKKNLRTFILTLLFWASQVVLVVKNPPANAGDLRDIGLIPGQGRSPGGGHGNPLQYCCMENPVDRGAWRAEIHGVTQSQTKLKQFSKGQHMIAFGIMYYHCLYTPLHNKIFYLLVTCSWDTICILVAIPYSFNELIIMLKCTLYC